MEINPLTMSELQAYEKYIRVYGKINIDNNDEYLKITQFYFEDQTKFIDNGIICKYKMKLEQMYIEYPRQIFISEREGNVYESYSDYVMRPVSSSIISENEEIKIQFYIDIQDNFVFINRVKNTEYSKILPIRFTEICQKQYNFLSSYKDLKIKLKKYKIKNICNKLLAFIVSILTIVFLIGIYTLIYTMQHCCDPYDTEHKRMIDVCERIDKLILQKKLKFPKKENFKSINKKVIVV